MSKSVWSIHGVFFSLSSLNATLICFLKDVNKRR